MRATKRHWLVASGSTFNTLLSCCPQVAMPAVPPSSGVVGPCVCENACMVRQRCKQLPGCRCVCLIVCLLHHHHRHTVGLSINRVVTQPCGSNSCMSCAWLFVLGLVLCIPCVCAVLGFAMHSHMHAAAATAATRGPDVSCARLSGVCASPLLQSCTPFNHHHHLGLSCDTGC